MNAWIVNHYAATSAEAGGTRHVALAEQLVRRGHKVSLFASVFDHTAGKSRPMRGDGAIQIEQNEGVQIGWIRTPAYRGNSFGRVWNTLVFALRVLRLPEYIHVKPDVIYGSTPSLFAALAAQLVAQQLGVPFVLEVRDIWPQTLIDLGVSRYHPFILLLGAIERYLYHRAQAIVTLLPNAAPHMVARGATLDRIHWIPNGVDFRLVPQVRAPERRTELVVMYAGAHGLNNSLETILDAALILKRTEGIPPIRFRFVGAGSCKDALLERAKALELDNVSFEPAIPKSEVYSVLAEADLLIATHKALGVHLFGVSMNKLHDYMAVARPMVFGWCTSNHPVLDAGCGFECTPESPEALAEAIRKICDMSQEERWAMGSRGRRYAEQNHDFSRLAEKLEMILESCIRQTRPRQALQSEMCD